MSIPINTSSQAHASIVSQETLQLREDVLGLCEGLADSTLQVASPQELEFAEDINVVIADYKARVEAHREAQIRPHLDAQRQINAICKPLLQALSDIKEKVGRSIIAYKAECERLRREKQRKLEEEQRRREEELRRQAEEKRRQAEDARRKAEEAEMATRQAKDDEDSRRMEDESRKNAENAEALEAQATELDFEMATPPPIVVSEAPKLKNTTIKGTWKAEITDPQAFVRYCVDNQIYELLQPLPKAYTARAKMLQREESFPGGRIYLKQSTAYRR